MGKDVWDVLLGSLVDLQLNRSFKLPGANIREWVSLAEHDYDDVDRLYIDFETQGGG